MGKILAICTSPKRGTVKTEVPSAVLTPEWGIISDAHGGSWHRQVSLLGLENIFVGMIVAGGAMKVGGAVPHDGHLFLEKIL